MSLFSHNVPFILTIYKIWKRALGDEMHGSEGGFSGEHRAFLFLPLDQGKAVILIKVEACGHARGWQPSHAVSYEKVKGCLTCKPPVSSEKANLVLSVSLLDSNGMGDCNSKHSELGSQACY